MLIVRHIPNPRRPMSFREQYPKMLRESGFSYICSTVKHLVRELQEVQPKVQMLIDSGSLNRSDLKYPESNNGCEIIP